MSHLALRVNGIGKRYRLGARVQRYPTLRDVLARSASALARASASVLRGAGGGETDPDWFWALRDVTFSVAEGETVAVIGGNGAGKSTLLKILSRITAPTTGRAEVRGVVGSLLEVGTGFHPE